MQNFTTKDLKNGMILTSTAGFKWIVFEEKLFTTETDVPLFLGSVKDDFSYDGRNFATQFIKVEDADGKVFWEKKEDKKPTLEDYKIMKAWNEATGRSIFGYNPPNWCGYQFVADESGSPYHTIPKAKSLSFLKAGDTYEFKIDPVMESLLNANTGPLKTSIATILAMQNPLSPSYGEIQEKTNPVGIEFDGFFKNLDKKVNEDFLGKRCLSKTKTWEEKCDEAREKALASEFECKQIIFGNMRENLDKKNKEFTEKLRSALNDYKKDYPDNFMNGGIVEIDIRQLAKYLDKTFSPQADTWVSAIEWNTHKQREEHIGKLERIKCECAGNSFDEIEVELEETIEQVFTLPDICEGDTLYEVHNIGNVYSVCTHQFESFHCSMTTDGAENVFICVENDNVFDIDNLDDTLFTDIDDALDKMKELVTAYEQK